MDGKAENGDGGLEQPLLTEIERLSDAEPERGGRGGEEKVGRDDGKYRTNGKHGSSEVGCCDPERCDEAGERCDEAGEVGVHVAYGPHRSSDSECRDPERCDEAGEIGEGDMIRKPTPYRTLAIVAFAIFASCLQVTQLFPFLYFMVRDFHVAKSEENIGRYAGVIGSSVVVGRFLTSVPWGMVADQYGRKPVMIFGNFAAATCNFLFGMSPTYEGAVTMRFLSGAVNSIISVAKAYLSELCSEEDQPLALSLISVAWSGGLIIGPVAGGFLAQPSKSWPNAFNDSTWYGRLFMRHPYLLPCAATSTMIYASVLGLVTIPETIQRRKPIRVVKDDEEKQASEPVRLPEAAAGIKHTQGIAHIRGDEPAHGGRGDEHSRLCFQETKLFGNDGGGNDELRRPLLTADHSGRSKSDGSDRLNAVNGHVGRETLGCHTSNGNTTDSQDRVLDLWRSVNSSFVMPMEKVGKLAEGTVNGSGAKRVNADGVNRPEEHFAVDEEDASEGQKSGGGGDGGASREKISIDNRKNYQENPHDLEASTTEEDKGYGNFLLQPKVIISVMFFTVFSFSDLMFQEVFSLWCVSPVKLGGLGFTTQEVGSVLCVAGIGMLVNGIFICPRVVRTAGPLLGARFALLILSPLHLVFPALAKFFGQTKSSLLLHYILTLTVLIRNSTSSSIFTCANMMLNNSVESCNRGKVNGFAMSVSSLGRAMAPVAGGFLFSWSQSPVARFLPLGNHFVFLVLVLTHGAAGCLLLPAITPNGLDGPLKNKSGEELENGREQTRKVER